MTQGLGQLGYLLVHSQGAGAEEKIIPRATSTGSTKVHRGREGRRRKDMYLLMAICVDSAFVTTSNHHQVMAMSQ